MSLLEFGLSVVGMPANEIEDVKAALPVTAAILDEAKEVEPIIEQARPHIDAMIPHVQALVPLFVAAWPHLQKMWPKIVQETPVIQEIIAFVRSKA